MILVKFKFVGIGTHSTICVSNDEELVEVCALFESSDKIVKYSLIDSDSNDPIIDSVKVYQMNPDAFPKFRPWHEWNK